MNIYYVYELFDPLLPDQPFYVGKGQRRRMYLHEYYSKKGTHYNKYLSNKILKILNDGREIGKRKLIENISSEEATKIEIQIIAQYRRNGIKLCNFTDGGDGSPGYRHTEEEKQKMRGRIVSEESKKKMSIAHIGKPGYWTGKKKPPTFKGRTHTEETKKRISQAKIGKKMPDEIKKRISKKLKGKIPWNKGIKMNT